MVFRVQAPRSRRNLRVTSMILASVLIASARVAKWAARSAADDAAAPPRSIERPKELSLGAPVAPPTSVRQDFGVGLGSLCVNGGTLAAIRSDGRVLVRTADVERVVEPPEDGEAFRVLSIAGDGVPVVVTTRGRVALLEVTGVRFLTLAVQRSAKPSAIPGSTDVVLGSEDGSIRRLVRSRAQPTLVDLVPRGDAPVGALAASLDRVVYARLDGTVLSIPLVGGDPTVLARPVRMVRSIHFLGTRPFAVIGSDFVALDQEIPRPRPACPGAGESPDIVSAAVAGDAIHVALVAADVIEVRRTSDGTRVRTDALTARRASALAWSADGRTLLVATGSEARPYSIPVEFGLPIGPINVKPSGPR